MGDLVELSANPPQGDTSIGWTQLSTLLIPGEAVTAFAVQHRLFALVHRRQVAAATTGRFVFMTRGLIAGFDPVTIRWQDLKDVQLKVGILAATLTIHHYANMSDTALGDGGVATLVLRGFEKAGAQQLYREAQAQEQAWREKRRVRSIEEMRAQAGGVQIATGLYPPGPTAGPAPHADVGPSLAARSGHPDGDPKERLARARSMLEDGLITDAEYEAIKANIIARL